MYRLSFGIGLVLLVGLIGPPAFAQRPCCSFMGLTPYSGIVPYDNQSGFGLQYRYRSFHGYDGQSHRLFPAGTTPFVFGQNESRYDKGDYKHGTDPNDFEVFRSVEWRGKMYLHKRVELSAVIPYTMTSTHMSGKHIDVGGLGDVTVVAGYHVLRPHEADTSAIKHRLILSAGFKAPTGRWDLKDAEGKTLGLLLQPGTGSWDGVFSADYMLGWKKWGFHLQAAARINGENPTNVGVSNGYAGAINAFRQFPVGKRGKVTLIPSVQTTVEYANGLTYKGGEDGRGLLSAVFFAGPGLDVHWGKVAMRASMHWPVAQAQNTSLRNAGRFQIGVGVNFAQRKFLTDLFRRKNKKGVSCDAPNE